MSRLVQCPGVCSDTVCSFSHYTAAQFAGQGTDGRVVADPGLWAKLKTPK